VSGEELRRGVIPSLASFTAVLGVQVVGKVREGT